MSNLINNWNNAINDMQKNMSAVSFELYIKTLEVIGIDGDKLILLTSTASNKNQIQKFLKDRVLSAIKNNFEDINDIILLEPNEKEDYLIEKEKSIEKPAVEQNFNEKYKLNEKYTFETFVVGNSNKFVFAAAQSVAENPGKKYNPLFIYGGVGLGKTHLLHAIGNYARKNNPNIKVLYTTCEKFAIDYIQSLKANKTEDANKAFRDKYRQVDILMIDDIQFLAKKKSTQEEFFSHF